jgi:PAS domain S-box-containing protein
LKVLCFFNAAAGLGFGIYLLTIGTTVPGMLLILLGLVALMSGFLFSSPDANITAIVLFPALVYQALGVYLGFARDTDSAATLSLLLVIPVYLTLAGFFATRMYQILVASGISAASLSFWLYGSGLTVLEGMKPSLVSIAVWGAWGLLTGFSLFLFFDLRRYTTLEAEAAELTARLTARERQYRLLAESSRDMIYRMRLPDCTYEYVSPASMEITGFSPAEYYAHPLIIRNRIHSDWIGYLEEELEKVLEGNPSPTYEYPIIHKSGEIRWLFQRNSLVLDDEGNPAALQGIVTDITRRKADELKLEQTVEDKDFLIREVHHRVKNNLAMISSLIAFKQREIGDEVSLKDLESKINAIQAVHSMLYQGGRVDAIDMSRYMRLLLKGIFSGTAGLETRLDLRVEEISLHPDTAIPLGLLLNEIATNAQKHSFSRNSDNTFFLEMKRTGRRSCLIVIIISGRPFPEEVDPSSTSSLGLKLIDALVKQLSGELELKKHPTTEYHIRFPIPGEGE